jgi:hypothetical protein
MQIGRRDEPRAGAAKRRRGTGLATRLLTAALLVTASSVLPTASAAADPTGPAPVTTQAPPSQPPPEFLPPPECQAQHAALFAVRQQIDAHNARPHLFRLPAQAAAAAAYDAEAGQLTAAQQTALANLELCLQVTARTRALAALAGWGSNGPPVPTAAPERVRTQLDEARRTMPSRWMPAPPPRSGKPWRVAPDSPMRPVYDVLRKRNPGDIGDVSLRGVPRPRADDADPAYPGSTVGRRSNGGADVSPDHIVPLAELVQMPGFSLLNADNMYAVANAPLNLQWLSGRANLAKGSRTAADILGVDPQWRRSQVALQEEVRAQLRDLITFLVYGQGDG